MWKALQKRRSYFDEPNEYRILRVVRDTTSISRTEISHQCNLSKTTVTEIVARFLKAGFLEFVGEGSSTRRGGRKRELLRFNPRASYVVGVDISMRHVQTVVTDLNANILERSAFDHAPGSPPDQVLQQVSNILRQWEERHPEYFRKGVGIGLGLPGLIDRTTGVVLVADTLKGWRNLNLRQYFEERFGLSTFVENDVKAMTLAEYLFGAGKHVPNQVFLWIGDGIGAGIIIDGKLHHGITSSAGEVGYNEVGFFVTDKSRFPLLYAGQRDFGEILSDAGVIQSYHRNGGRKTVAGPEALIRAAASGDTLANQVVDEIASLISAVCINLINTLNPELIVLGGRLVDGATMVHRVQERVREDILSMPAEAVHIRPAKLGGDGVLVGSAGLVLYDLFKPAGVRKRTPAAVAETQSNGDGR